jgi:hypothetical protein
MLDCADARNVEESAMVFDGRMPRRMLGMLRARLPELGLEQSHDPRGRQGRRWPLVTLLRAVLVGLLAGAHSLAETEWVTDTLSQAARRALGLPRRIADTTLRDLLCRLAPSVLRHTLHTMVRAAYRRHALEPDGLPFGVVAMDGKGTALPSCDDHYAQRQTAGEGHALVGLLRTMTCSLVSSRARACLDAIPIPASMNEMSQFSAALRSLCAAYRGLDLFRLVSYDAGACSESNAAAVRSHGLHYLLGLKGPQPTLLAEAQRLLARFGPECALAQSEDATVAGGRWVRRLYISAEMAHFQWDHLRTVLRIESEKLDANGQQTAYENRYFLSSLPLARLSPAQWLLVVRRHWGVENNCHHTLDAVFQEDEHPWIDGDPQGALAVLLLRRVAYNLLSLFRSVTQRSDERRAAPWRWLIDHLAYALQASTDADIASLRLRPTPLRE